MWTFAIKQKMTAAALLFAVIVLVILTNLREQRTTDRISATVTSLYEDRLVVAQYILQLSTQVDGIIFLLEKEGTQVTEQINTYLTKVNALNALYEQTTLTETERVSFEHFKQLCQTIARYNETAEFTYVLESARDAAETLQTLSSIQVEEGKNILDEVLDMNYFSNVFSTLELVILIVIAFIIQALVFTSKTIRGIKKPGRENLN